MELNEVLLKRRSVRKFTDEPVPDMDIEELMHAAMSGPSACNKKPWDFFVVTSPDLLKKLRGATAFTRIESPLAIVVAGNLSRALPFDMGEFWVQDCSAATENILLRSADLGLGTVWCGIYPNKSAVKKVSEILSLPKKQIPLNVIYVGYPAETPEPRDQYDCNNVHYLK